jgi:hypothetical protein
VLGLVVVAFTLAVGASSADAAGLVWGAAGEILHPASPAPAVASDHFTDVSCWGAGDCAAIGYLEAESHYRVIVATESNGIWGQAGLVQLANVNATESSLESIACVAPGDCAAVGYEKAPAEAEQAIVISATGGVWEAGATVIPSPSGAEGAVLDGVSCTGPGTCTAVGGAPGVQSVDEPKPMAVSEKSGSWEAAELVAEPPSANPGGELESISCPAAGECMATGWYSATTTLELFGAHEVEGHWSSEEIEVEGDLSPESTHFHVSCSTPQSCGASGYFSPGSTYTALAATYQGGNWSSAAQVISAPSLPGGPEDNFLDGLSCPVAGACSSIGGWYDYASSEYLPMITSLTASGEWGASQGVTLPSDAITMATAEALNVSPEPSLEGISCWAAGDCAAVGYYMTEAGEFVPMVDTETAGVWGAAEKVGVPTDADPVGEARLEGVSCTATEACGAVGIFEDQAGELRGMGISAQPPSTAVITTPPAVPGAPNQPSPTPPPKPSKPTLKIGSLELAKGGLKVSLSCGKAAACKGTLLLTKIGAGKKTSKAVLARASYTIPADRQKTVALKLTASGRNLLTALGRKHAKSSAAKLTATVAGGATQSKSVRLP